jgi:nucleotide-binding universal stress UspA family protein
MPTRQRLKTMENLGAEIDRILLATDFGRRSAGAENHALKLAESFDSKLLLVHAIEPIGDLDDEDEQNQELREFYSRLEEQAENHMRERSAEYDEQGIVSEHYIEIGYRWQVILDLAEELQVDLVVLGRRSYEGRESISLGTTSQKVYFACNRPVLLVPEA